MADSEIICVLGMHRSGTSVVTRILNIIGVYLGPEAHLLPPLAENPKGFWEHQPIMKLNEKILSRLGGNWHSPPNFSKGWETSSEFEDLREQARALIQADFTGAELWGWKDPRTCLTLPFWQHLLPLMRYLICLRHPVEVARSLERRNDFSFGQSIYLWLVYLKFVLEHTIDQQRCLIFYEDLVGNWEQELQRLSQLLRKPVRADQTEAQSAVRDFIDENLWHHRISTVESIDEARLDISVKALFMAQQVYVCLQRETPFQHSNTSQTIQDALDIISPEEKKEAWEKRIADRWMERLHMATKELMALIPPGDTFILVDQEQWGTDDVVAGRRRIPFIERDGRYWGLPPDDDIAIRELERLRESGVNFMVFGWTTFWWLDYYRGLKSHLRSSYHCALENDHIVVFDLRAATRN